MPFDRLPAWISLVTPALRAIRPTPGDGRRPFDLVLFDMDGTVVDEKSSWEWVHDHFGVSNDENWRAYQEGRMNDEEFMRSDIAMWRPDNRRIHRTEVEAVLRKAPLMPGAQALVAKLKAAGVATAIVSGGLDILARRVCEITGIDMYVANGLVLDADGYLEGNGVCVVEIRDKGRPTRALLEALGVPPGRAAAVGNSIWDATMFAEVGFSIAFAPFPDGVTERADVVIHKKDLRLCAPHLLGDAEGAPSGTGPVI